MADVPRLEALIVDVCVLLVRDGPTDWAAAVALLESVQDDHGEVGVFGVLTALTRAALLPSGDGPGAPPREGTWVVEADADGIDAAPPGVRTGVRFLAAAGNGDLDTMFALFRAAEGLEHDQAALFLELVLKAAQTGLRHAVEHGPPAAPARPDDRRRTAAAPACAACRTPMHWHAGASRWVCPACERRRAQGVPRRARPGQPTDRPEENT